MRNLTGRLASCLAFAGAALNGHAQATTNPAPATKHRSYAGLEAGLFFNQATQLSQSAPGLTPNREVNPTAALVFGYWLAPAVALEARAQDLPLTTGFDYTRTTAGRYLGVGKRYTQEYLYASVLGVWRVLGRHSRLALDVAGGGGLAFTDTSPSFVTPNGTEVYYHDAAGGIGSGPAAPAGTTVDATVTQLLAQQQGTVGVLEAGLRGSWQVRPRLALDLSLRQLWGLTASVCDIEATIITDTETIATVQRTPLRGTSAGLAVRYSW